MRVFLIAGESSGDALGAALMAGLKQLVGDITFDGVGGPLMQAEGLSSRFEMSELSVMGIAEVLPKYFHLKRRISQMADAVVETQPDVMITIDSPDFCLRVARLVKERSKVRTVHYVAPSVWAWRPKRAEKMAKSIDHVLALLPFEPPYMTSAGMACDFVGHPVVTDPVASDAEVAAFRKAHGVDGPLLLVLPGSRKGEVTRLSPVFGAAVASFVAQHPSWNVALVRAPSVADRVDSLLADWSIKPIVVPGDDAARKRAVFAAADLALAASGTVSLELAASNTPMVIGYTMNAISYRIIRSMALIDRVNLVNIVANSSVVPECLGPDCTPDRLSQALAQIASSPGAQRDAMKETMRALNPGENPGLRAARAVLDGLSVQKS